MVSNAANIGRTQASESHLSSHALILANPHAGGLSRFSNASSPAGSSDHLTALQNAAQEAGLQATVEVVPPPEQLKARLHRAQQEGYDTIVAAGGDGTIRVMAQAILDTPLRLGILPLGTANNFVHSLGLPFDLPSAMQVLAAGKEHGVDVG